MTGGLIDRQRPYRIRIEVWRCQGIGRPNRLLQLRRIRLIDNRRLRSDWTKGKMQSSFSLSRSKASSPNNEAQTRPGHTSRPVLPDSVDGDGASLRPCIASLHSFSASPRGRRMHSLTAACRQTLDPAHRREHGRAQTSLSCPSQHLDCPPFSRDDRCGWVCCFLPWSIADIRRIGSRQRLNDPRDPSCEPLYVHRGPCISDWETG